MSGKVLRYPSIALIFTKGYKVNAKIDPYLNVDAGTMNPTEHGEVFVYARFEDRPRHGNYERFSASVETEDYMTSGMVSICSGEERNRL